MAIAAARAACVVFLLLGLLVYRSVAASPPLNFDARCTADRARAALCGSRVREGDTVVPPEAARLSCHSM
jgi:hypothetical protein